MWRRQDEDTKVYSVISVKLARLQQNTATKIEKLAYNFRTISENDFSVSKVEVLVLVLDV